MNILDVFNVILIDPLINVLLGLYHLALIVHLPGPLGWAIIFLTILVRLVVYPFVSTQLNHQKKMNELRPHLAELKKKHGKDAKRHREEQTKLYQEHGINPAAGCLPLLIQLPILIGLYNVFFSILNGQTAQALNHINNVAYFSWLRLPSLDDSFLGLNLAFSPAHYGLLSPFILIPIVTALVQFLYSRMSQPPAPAPSAKGEQSFEDALASSQSTLFFLFPLMTGYFAYTFPIGLALYWNVTNIFAIIQQYLISGPGGLAKWLPKSLQKLPPSN